MLRRKYVLLLISDLDILQEELSVLEHIYHETRQQPTRQDSPYEIIWLPTLDPAILWTESRQKQFETLQANMPWYTLHHPSLIDRVVIKFIKEMWNFRKKHILVVLDSQGKVASPNALHMMWIWGSAAFPFTTLREENLWEEESWRLELLVNGIDPVIQNWVSSSPVTDPKMAGDNHTQHLFIYTHTHYVITTGVLKIIVIIHPKKTSLPKLKF